MLTEKQRDLLLFIHDRIEAESIAPSFEEMKDHLGLASKSGVHRLISALVERGFLERLPNRARALHVKKLPDQLRKKINALPDPVLHPVTQNARKSARIAIDRSVEQIPLYGKIAAGTPIEAIRHEGQSVDVPAFLLGPSEYYALNVDGDSMMNAGIHDGDVVIIERTSQARNGDIVVALVDGEEVTLKTFKRDGNIIMLIPENPAHDIRALDASRVEIQGKLASLYRTYH